MELNEGMKVNVYRANIKKHVDVEWNKNKTEWFHFIEKYTLLWMIIEARPKKKQKLLVKQKEHSETDDEDHRNRNENWDEWSGESIFVFVVFDIWLLFYVLQI